MMRTYLPDETFPTLTAMRNNASGFSSLLGVRVCSIGRGRATAEIQEVSDRLVNPTGRAIHGGVVFALADIAGGSAAWSHGEHVATSSVDIHYLNPVKAGYSLRAEATEWKAGKRLLVYRIEVMSADGTVIAVATASYVPLGCPILEEFEHEA